LKNINILKRYICTFGRGVYSYFPHPLRGGGQTIQGKKIQEKMEKEERIKWRKKRKKEKREKYENDIFLPLVTT